MKLGAIRNMMGSVPDLQGVQLQQWLQKQLHNMGLDPSALYQELEMTSPYVDTHRDTSYANARMQLHSHTFYELLYCCGNCGAEYLVGSERYRLQQGDVVFVPPGVSHRPLLPEQMPEPYMRYVLWLSQEFIAQYASLFSDSIQNQKAGVHLLRTAGTRWEHLGELFRAGVLEAERRDHGWEAAVIGNTIQLLTQLKRARVEQSAQPMPVEQPELLDRIMAYVESHYAEEISIAALSRQFYVSESSISHLFKKKLGVSLYCYVTQRRLIAAKTLIEQGISLGSVSAQTGFHDYSGFYRAFKQSYGISPRQYRNLQAQHQA